MADLQGVRYLKHSAMNALLAYACRTISRPQLSRRDGLAQGT
jgi:hypothetical protein